MKRNVNELFAKMPPESSARASGRAREMLQEMALADVRKARAQTQQGLAKALSVNQAWVSRMERQTDMYLSTLRGYVEALGGKLELNAKFDDCTIPLASFASSPPEGAAVPIAANASSGDTPLPVWDVGGDAAVAVASEIAAPVIAEPCTRNKKGRGAATTSTQSTQPVAA